jgi:hypothetical protein
MAYAANLAMATLNGNQPSNVHILRSADSGLGTFLMAITVDSTFPLPLGVEATGQILVASLLANPEFAIMTIIFTDLNIKKGIFSVRNISTIPVELSPADSELLILYQDMDINSESDTLLTVGMSQGQIDAEYQRYLDMKTSDGTQISDLNFWCIRGLDNGTPEDPTDDTYQIVGSETYISEGPFAGDYMNVIMHVTMKTTCKNNPLVGGATFQNYGRDNSKINIGYLLLSSRNICDGNMKVEGAAGIYAKWSGRLMALDLDK